MSKSYVCPGEEYPISRSVHLARLAAFYPKCRHCPHRKDFGALTPQVVERWERDQRQVEPRSVWSDEGIRGVYLNELTRQRVSEYVAALAAELWSRSPLVGRSDGRLRSPRPRRQGPTVVVGRDERASSPDIFVGVVQTLRRMSCQVRDVGLVSKACFCFAVDHLQAMAGVYVTGAGWPSTWTGCDFVGPGGRPLASGGGLDRLARRMQLGCQRPTRSAGAYRPFQAQVPYEAALWKHFHDVRPVTVVCCTRSRAVERTLARLFEKIPCRLVLVPPRPAAQPFRPLRRQKPAGMVWRNSDGAGRSADDTVVGWLNDAHPSERTREDPQLALANEVKLAAQAVRQADAEVGLVIAEDGMRCVVLDEQGRPIDQAKLVRLLTEAFLADAGAARVVLPTRQLAELRPQIESAGGIAADGGETAESVWEEALNRQAHFALDPLARFWLRESVPLSDALLVLGRVLDVLTASPTARLSELAACDDQMGQKDARPHPGSDVAHANRHRAQQSLSASAHIQHPTSKQSQQSEDETPSAKATQAAFLPRQ